MAVRTFGLTLAERVDALTIKDAGGCWTWTGHLNPGGYGTGTFTENGVSRTRVAHRAVYEGLVGPIGPGLVIEHECRNKACVRPGPGHCLPMTQKENCARSRKRNANARKTCCRRGHAYSPTNTYVDARGRRACRACHAISEWDRRHRLVA